MTLGDLAIQENKLVQQVMNYNGPIESKSQGLMQSGVFSAYEKLHTHYTDFAIKHSDVEALKRAIFIQWYSLAEPEFNSGIGNLNENVRLQALDEVQRLVLRKEVDLEFAWMLNCYFHITEFFVTPNERYQDLLKYLESMPVWNPSDGKDYSFDNRGQMGIYWQSRSNIK
jgi:hypothetical protein